MIDSCSNKPISGKQAIQPIVLVRSFLFSLSIATFFLMALGSATRVMNAGLSCPDWPLCYGSIVPAEQMNLQVFLEWFHRVVASVVGFLTLTFAATSWFYRRLLPKWLPWGALGALMLVMTQGILGGLTVTELLRFDVVTAHLGTGLLFFSTLLLMAATLTPFQAYDTASNLPWLGLGAVVLVYLQSILGALVASQWALHQCLANSGLCVVMNSHLAGVVPASLASIAVVVKSYRTPAIHPLLRRLAYTVGGLLLAQIAVGLTTYKLKLEVEPLTVMHQAVGAALLGTLVVFTVFAWRDRLQVRQASRVQDLPASSPDSDLISANS